MAVPPSTEELLAGLTAAQRAAVTSEAAPLCIMAAAGAGKTRVLTRRIAYRCLTGRAEPGHTLAVTFTRKAAGELRHRLAGLGLRDGVAAGTFHAHATAQLQRWWADRRQSPPTLLDRKSRLLGPLIAGRPGFERVPLAELASAIEWAQARAIGPERFEAELQQRPRLLPAGVGAAATAAVYARYEAEKRRRGLIDFDDLLGRCADALERDPEFAGAQRWRWRHVFVDEFQDLNPLQHRLLLAWLGSSTDLCVVGDPNQAIYGWNGADPTLLADLPRRWPSAEVLHLDDNHRCSEQIVRVAASVLGPAGRRLRAAGRHGPSPVLRSYESDAAEARGIAAAISAAGGEGSPWSSMAVLTRTNAQLSVLASALGAAGIPWWSAASAALLDDPVGRDLIGEWRRRGHQPLSGVLADLREMIDQAGPDGPQVLQGLLEAGQAFVTLQPGATAGEWLDWLPSADRDRSAGGAGHAAVTLSSFHRAKGLEWERVWVAGVEEGLVPLGRSDSGPAETEERQLLYVALTRAVEHLTVSWARSRSFGGRPVPRRPSRWLGSIEAAIDTGAGPGGPGAGSTASAEQWRRRLAEQRAGLRQGAPLPPQPGPGARGAWPEPDPAVRDAIRAWRLETARHTGVPPAVLLHDATVDALARRRPATMDELLAVPGFGPVKAQRYGAPILDILGERAESA
ncbi:MAG TPA: ATP-dependent DNA helicase UvrD2 [Acidimicrobiales bacterium]|nr:ATP-dependent DNA helicase UvrD2 [Acidimicrobiales bacterium]